MIEVTNFKILNALPSVPEKGEMAYCTEEETYYTYDEGWNEIPKQGKIDTGITLYDLNKTVIAKMPDLTKSQIEEKAYIINDYIQSKESKYFMLLSNELHYYTVFAINNDLKTHCWFEVIDCLKAFDCIIKDIVLREDETAVEIWVKQDDQIYAMFFFDYESGVIECHQ